MNKLICGQVVMWIFFGLLAGCGTRIRELPPLEYGNNYNYTRQVDQTRHLLQTQGISSQYQGKSLIIAIPLTKIFINNSTNFNGEEQKVLAPVLQLAKLNPVAAIALSCSLVNRLPSHHAHAFSLACVKKVAAYLWDKTKGENFLYARAVRPIMEKKNNILIIEFVDFLEKNC